MGGCRADPTASCTTPGCPRAFCDRRESELFCLTPKDAPCMIHSERTWRDRHRKQAKADHDRPRRHPGSPVADPEIPAPRRRGGSGAAAPNKPNFCPCCRPGASLSCQTNPSRRFRRPGRWEARCQTKPIGRLFGPKMGSVVRNEPNFAWPGLGSRRAKQSQFAACGSREQPCETKPIWRLRPPGAIVSNKANWAGQRGETRAKYVGERQLWQI